MSLINREELLRRLKLHGRRKDGKTVIPEWMQVAIKEVEHMPEAKAPAVWHDGLTKDTIAFNTGLPKEFIEKVEPHTTVALPHDGYDALLPANSCQFFDNSVCESTKILIASNGYQGGDAGHGGKTDIIFFLPQSIAYDTPNATASVGIYSVDLHDSGLGSVLHLWGEGDWELDYLKYLFRTALLLLEYRTPYRSEEEIWGSPK